jgi:hypothetical protein
MVLSKVLLCAKTQCGMLIAGVTYQEKGGTAMMSRNNLLMYLVGWMCTFGCTRSLDILALEALFLCLTPFVAPQKKV